MKIKIIKKLSTLVLAFFVLIIFGAITIINANATVLRANGKIAFTSNRNGNLEIYVMDADGKNQVRLTNISGIDNHSAFSPDGKKIAFISQNDSGRFSIKFHRLHYFQ